MLDEDKQPFLGEMAGRSTDTFDSDHCGVGITSKHKFRGNKIIHWIVILIALVTTLSLAANVWMICRWLEVERVEKRHGLKDIYSPADEVIQYEIVDVGTEDPSDIYIGPPTDESDRAWTELLAPTAIRVYADEMREANRQSVRVHHNNQEIYIGALEVYHQLHCVKRMIQNRWPERYPKVAAMGAFSDSHFNHCIQVLRKGIMCTADRSMDTWTYNATGDPILHKAPRKCANWDRLHSWAQERTLGAFTKVDVYKLGEEGWYGPQ